MEDLTQEDLQHIIESNIFNIELANFCANKNSVNLDSYNKIYLCPTTNELKNHFMRSLSAIIPGYKNISILKLVFVNEYTSTYIFSERLLGWKSTYDSGIR